MSRDLGHWILVHRSTTACDRREPLRVLGVFIFNGLLHSHRLIVHGLSFEYEFYEQIFRPKRCPGLHGTKRPMIVAQYTIDVVYARLAPGVLEELQRVNPHLPSRRRQHKHHHWFTPELGHPKLREHLVGVLALMRASPDWSSFMRLLKHAYPKKGENVPILFPSTP